MTKRVRLLVGTKKGAFILDSDESRREWSISAPLCEGWPVHDLIVEPGTGAILAASGNAVVRPGRLAERRRRDDLEPFLERDDLRRRGRADQDDLVARGGAGRLAARGRRTGRSVPEHGPRGDLDPRRGPDQPSDPADLGTGRRRAHPPHDHPPPDRHGPDVGRDLGRRRLRDARWRDVVGGAQRRRSRRVQPRRTASRRPASASTSSRWPPASPRRSTSATTAGSTAPTTARRPGRRSPTGCRPTSGSRWSPTRATPTPAGSSRSACPRRAATCPTAIRRSGGRHDRGASWICSDAGLPTHDAYMSVLREAMARDTLDPVGITFGTETGQLWHSSDDGESWRMITDTLPEIWAVEAVVLDG